MKKEQVFIYHHLQITIGLDSLKWNLNKVDIDELKVIPACLSNLKSDKHKLDVDGLKTLLTDLKKLSDDVDMMLPKQSIA